MTTSHTFNVHFWLKKTLIKSDGTVPIYARISIDSIRVDLSTKETVFEEHWNFDAKRVKSRIKNAKCINDTLDDIYTKIKRLSNNLKKKEE